MKDEKLFLGIDVGTTGTKTLLIAETGDILGSAYCGYETAKPGPGFSEQDPLDWWNAVVQTVREVCRTAGRNDVAAISLSTQGGTVFPADRSFRPLRPAAVWDDSRCEQERRQYLEEVGDAASMYEKTGWKLSISLPALQIRWIKNREPELFAGKPLFLTVADYLAAKLTGRPCVDLSNAGINELVDIRRGCYDEALLAFAGITEDQLPRLVRSGTAVGTLTPEAAEELGIPAEAVFVAGAHDQYAVAAGAGAVKDGDILIGSGTSWVVTVISDRPRFESNMAQSVAAAEGMWGSIQSLSSAGICLEWLRKHIISDGSLSLAEIDRQCETAKASAAGLYFYPFGCLLRQNAEGKMVPTGTFAGMDLSNTKFDLARAVMEGVAFQITRMLEAAGVSFDRIKLAGGAAKSRFWTQLLADILGKPVVVPAVSDLACVGAAILAGVGCGVYQSIADGYGKLAVREKTVFPSAETARYREAFAVYGKKIEYIKAMYR